MSFSRRGGARIGAGRPKSPTSGVPHLSRPALSGREPVHVTMRVCEHVFQLRSRRCFAVIRAALAAGCDRHGLRVTAISVQGNHLHLIAEAGSAPALSRGLQALAVRLARGLNRLMGRTGRVFADRYHSHVLRTPREVRAALAYVAGNASRHAAQYGRPVAASSSDPFTIGYFGERVLLPPDGARLLAEPRTWLLCAGWRRAAAPATRSGRWRFSPMQNRGRRSTAAAS